jgi:hypothetical protein
MALAGAKVIPKNNLPRASYFLNFLGDPYQIFQLTFGKRNAHLALVLAASRGVVCEAVVIAPEEDELADAHVRIDLNWQRR